MTEDTVDRGTARKHRIAAVHAARDCITAAEHALGAAEGASMIDMEDEPKRGGRALLFTLIAFATPLVLNYAEFAGHYWMTASVIGLMLAYVIHHISSTDSVATRDRLNDRMEAAETELRRAKVVWERAMAEVYAR